MPSHLRFQRESLPPTHINPAVPWYLRAQWESLPPTHIPTLQCLRTCVPSGNPAGLPHTNRALPSYLRPAALREEGAADPVGPRGVPPQPPKHTPTPKTI
eukprot:59727-Chlamydomonas_euryale.AAC.3